MPVTVEQALARAAPLILAGATHPDYARTVAYAAQCHDLETGNTARFLARFTQRESTTEYAARLALTVSTLPALWREFANPFRKVSRMKGALVEKTVEWADAPSDAQRSRRAEALNEALGRYHADKPLEDYLADVVVQSWALTDPNAWLLTEFAPFDFRTARARPYPVLLPSEAVVDFTRAAGVVDSLTARVAIASDGVKGYRYTVYLDTQSLDFWPVLDANGKALPTLPAGSAVAGTLTDTSGRVVYEYRILTHNAGRVPATPLGYAPDPETQGRTFVSPLDPALCFLLKEVKNGSELDIVMATTVHPHKSQFVAACGGRADHGGCNSGIAPQGHNGGPGTCTVCNGSGQAQIATSATDVLTYPLPRKFEDIEKMPDLSKMVYFARPPIEIPRFQVEYSEHLRQRCWQVLFSRDSVQQTTGTPTPTATATERLQQAEKESVALSPLADFLSATYCYHAQVAAAYVDVAADLRVSYRFPADLIPPQLTDLLAVYDAAAKAGADPALLEDINKRMIRQKLADDPQALREMEVRWRFVPYLGAPQAVFAQYGALGWIGVKARTLRVEQDAIFADLKRENPNFYDLPQAAQQVLVDATVDKYVALLPGAAGGGGAFPKMDFSKPQPAPAN